MSVRDAYARKKARQTARSARSKTYSIGGATYDTETGNLLSGKYVSGIQLPDQSNNLANQAGQAEEQDLTAGLSTSLPSVNRSEIESQTRSELSGSRSAIESKYGREIADFQEQAQQQERALEGQLGTRRRFSSSAEAFITFINDKNNKTIANLESQKEEALANFDFKLAQLIDSRVAEERQAAQQEFANAITMMELQEKQRKEKLAEQAPTIQASREAAIFGLLKQGVEDPVEIADLINFDDKGKQIGDFSIEEITKTLEKVKQDKTEVDKIIVDLGKNGAPPEIIDAVSKSKSLTSAVKAAGDYLVSGSGDLGEALAIKRDMLSRGLIPPPMDQLLTSVANQKARAAAIADGTYTTAQNKFITALNNTVSKNATYSKTTSMRNYGDNVLASLSQETGVGDIAAINQFQKVIDEGAVTRDQDVKLIQGSQSLADTLKTKIKKLQKGEQLSSELRKEMKTAVEAMYAAQVKALQSDPFIKSKVTEAKNNGVSIEDTILGELENFASQSGTVNALVEQEEQAKSAVETYLATNPSKASWVADLYEQLNATDSEIYEYLKRNGSIK